MYGASRRVSPALAGPVIPRSTMELEGVPEGADEQAPPRSRTPQTPRPNIPRTPQKHHENTQKKTDTASFRPSTGRNWSTPSSPTGRWWWRWLHLENFQSGTNRQKAAFSAEGVSLVSFVRGWFNKVWERGLFGRYHGCRLRMDPPNGCCQIPPNFFSSEILLFPA